MNKGLKALDILINHLEIFDNTAIDSFEGEYKTIEKELNEKDFLENLLHNLVLTQVDGKWIFTLDRLSKDEKEYVHRTWSNSL